MTFCREDIIERGCGGERRKVGRVERKGRGVEREGNKVDKEEGSDLHSIGREEREVGGRG